MDTPSRKAEIAALVDEEVARAMSPYRALGLSTEVLEEMELLLRFALNNHPDAQRLLRQLLPDPVVVRSADVDTTGTETTERADKKDQGA